METSDTIIRFWFGEDTDDVAAAQEKSSLWWSKNPAVDAQMRERFLPCLDSAMRGELDAWKQVPAGRLALILLADQFSRNIHRGTPLSFASDPLARAWCKEGLPDGIDKTLRPIERVFFYMPLEHSESLEDQERAVALFQALAADVAPAYKPAFDDYVEFAIRHRDIIRRFGRFPHRNAILQRQSSAEELTFLREPGSSF